MEVPLTPEQETRLTKMARDIGINPEELVRTAVLSILSEYYGNRKKKTALPVLHLGEMQSLHRRDLYDDAG
jgi:hypothetical protein